MAMDPLEAPPNPHPYIFSTFSIPSSHLLPPMAINSPQFILFFFIAGGILCHPAAGQPPPDPDYGNSISPSVGIVVIALFVSLFLLGFFSLYIRHCAGDYSSAGAGAGVTAGISRRAPRGLDAAAIESFPTFDYASIKSLQIGKSALECAVCLNEFEDDETLRLIPKCDHVFHPDCIDAWLAQHTTCPVCRADLTLLTDASLHAPQLGQIAESESAHNDVIVDVAAQTDQPPPECESEVMERERPLNRSRTRRSASGRPRWFGMFSHSNSTGHVAVKQWENMERFTLRLPEEVRRQIISGKLNRTTSCVALPREGSSRRGPRAGPVGEGSSRGRLFGSLRADRPAARSDRWAFSLAPPFFSKAPSVRSPKVAAEGGTVKLSKAGEEAKLPPV